MEALNALLRSALDLLLGALGGLPDWVELAVLALLVTVLVLPIIRWTFSYEWAERFKRGIYSGLFEIRLFNDRLGATFRGLAGVLGNTAAYLGAWLLPLLVMSVPMLPVFAHLHFHYGYDGLAPGSETVLTAEFAADRDGGKPRAAITAPPGLTVETPALWVPAQRQLSWRLQAVEPGDYDVEMTIDGERYAKSVVVSDESRRRSPLRPEHDFWQQLIYPAEPPLPEGSPLAAITVDYAERGSFLLVPNWCWILILLSIPFFLLLKDRFGVEV